LSLRSDDLHSVGEPYTEDDFRQWVVTVDATPVFFGDLESSVYLATSFWHRQRGGPFLNFHTSLIEVGAIKVQRPFEQTVAVGDLTSRASQRFLLDNGWSN
jgi:hypothetical protein